MKLPFWATFFTALGVCILCALGSWQLQRLEWKEDLLAKIAAKEESFRQFSIANLSPENEFTKGEISGTLLFDKQIQLQPRTLDGTPGVHIITPLKLNSGETILVNRGWAPLGYEEQETRSKTVKLAGMIRTIPEPNIFIPENIAESDSWYWVDLEALSTSKDLKNLMPVMLYEIDLTNGDDAGLYPNASALEIHLNNNHMQYALFWFSMAGVLIAVFILRFAIRKNEA
ncbi:MAG: SURF1 family protein [Pseudomonadota bacterium]